MESLYAINMHVKCHLCFPTMSRKKGERFLFLFSFQIPTRSQQHSAVRVAGRSRACGGSAERHVWHIYAPFWQKTLVKEGMRSFSSLSKARGQVCHMSK